MSRPEHHVLYTDPPWLVRDDGRVDPALATVEEQVLGSQVGVRFGPYRDGRYQLAGPELLERAAGCRVIVVYRASVTAELLDAAGDDLRAIVRQGVGVDNLNIPLLRARRLAGYHLPDYCVDEVAAHTLALALALERRLVPQHLSLTGGRFDIYAGGLPRRISGRTAGIIGFGRIGRAVARKLAACYRRILVHDPYLGPDLPEGYGAEAVATLPELLERSDLVTLHCPLSGETTGMVDDGFLQRMRPDSYLVNCARGKLVEPGALHRALAGGGIAGAGLDVYAPEDPHDDPRWHPVLRHPAVVVTSHRAFLSAEAEASSRRRTAELTAEVLRGGAPVLGRVSP